MYRLNIRKTKEKRKLRVRKKIYGTAKRPRLSVFRSLKYIYAQLIDDDLGRTLVDVNDSVKKIHDQTKKVDAAIETGRLLAKRALEKGIKSAVFDRNRYRYHGRVKNLAEGAREGGLKL